MAFFKDESYRTCSECGGDCEPEPADSGGLGIRIIFTCPTCGPQSIVDPFEERR